MPVRYFLVLLLLLLSAVALAAVDSRNKRGSANNAGEPWIDVNPNPDGTIGQADRAMLVGEYHGFAYSGAPVATDSPGQLSRTCFGFSFNCRYTK